ncbi:hydroxycarboxylic acid receptor 2-like [Hyperolius riggenbachi]|uniref:hydroxycarboxylic acid receptor 2-like n=1 Tax=Hyperolius riggenbachi TaxID=752182 RepID=UPI0035A26575
MNSSCCVFEEPLFNSVLSPFMYLEFVLGLGGNIIGLWMVCLEFKSWKPNSVYLLSVTLADFVVLICVYFRADYLLHHEDWKFGDIPCRLLLYVTASARASGMMVLSLIALDRYFRILFPFLKVNNITVRQAACLCFMVWLFVFSLHSYILTGPHFLNLNNATQCENFAICPQAPTSWQDTFYISLSILSLLTICYCTVCIAVHLKNNAIDTNGKVGRAMRFLIAVAVVFVVCYLPAATIRIIIIILKFMKIEDCEQFRSSNLGFYFVMSFTYFYSMLNPVLYYFSSPSSHNLIARLCNKKEMTLSETQIVSK